MRTLRGTAAVLFCLAALAACSDPSGPAHESAQLERHQRLWAETGIDDYRMTVRLTGAWFGGAAIVEVHDGVPVSTTAVGDYPPQSVQLFRSYDTVEELFDLVRRALAAKAQHLDASYDPRRGVPTSVAIDLRFDVADDEHGFVVEDFRVLE